MMAPSLSGGDLAAGQGHGLEHAFMPECRFLVGSLLIRLSGSGFLVSLTRLFACVHCHCNPD
jgi:hypothetical protein